MRPFNLKVQTLAVPVRVGWGPEESMSCLKPWASMYFICLYTESIPPSLGSQIWEGTADQVTDLIGFKFHPSCSEWSAFTQAGDSQPNC